MSNPRLIRTAARWSIDRDLAVEVLGRDVRCVYCNRDFDLSGPRSKTPSWEHIVNDATMVDSRNIALCCVGCNASKGRKALEVWLSSTYCKVRGISRDTIAPIAALALAAAKAAADDDGHGGECEG